MVKHIWLKLLLLALFAWAQVLFFRSSLFVITNFVVEGCSYCAPAQIIKASGLHKGEYIWSRGDFLFTSLKERMIDLQAVKNISWSMHPGGLVTFKVEERRPAVLLFCKDLVGNWFEVDSEGYILGPARPKTDLPHLRVDLAVSSRSRKISPPLVVLLLRVKPIIDEHFSKEIACYELDSAQNISLEASFLDRPVYIKLGVFRDLEYKCGLVKAILAKYKKLQKPLDYVDVRFDQPTVMVHGAKAKSAPDSKATPASDGGTQPANDSQTQADTVSGADSSESDPEALEEVQEN